jgi:hypothetical protein
MNVLVSSLVLPLALLLGQSTLSAQTRVPPQAEPTQRDGLPIDFPTKIWVQEGLRAIVAQMWTTSPTFRHQCLQIQEAGAVQVQLRVDPSLATNAWHRATCELRTFEGGALVARINVAPVRITELIGHELEHVCERLEGIHVDRESLARRSGYYLLDPAKPRYESDRAIRVGRQVLAEMSLAGSLTRTQQQP